MESSKKKDLLKKLKMPEKASKDPMLSADDSELALDGPAAPMDEAMPMTGDEAPAEEAAELHQLEDDVLVKEMEARGYKCEKAESETPDEGEPSDEVPLDSGAQKF